MKYFHSLKKQVDSTMNFDLEGDYIVLPALHFGQVRFQLCYQHSILWSRLYDEHLVKAQPASLTNYLEQENLDNSGKHHRLATQEPPRPRPRAGTHP